jgi:LysM repeat protein
MAARKGARFLAPLALAAAVAGTYLVVHQTLQHKHAPAAATQTSGQLTTPTAHTHRHRRSARFYVIKPGDSLSAIAVKTGVPLRTIRALNPGLDPSALQVGRRLRLR